MVYLIAILGGQGASLIFIALLQFIMSAMSVVCTHFVASLITSYFFGSVLFFTCLANGLIGTYALWTIIILGAIIFIVATMVIPETEEDAGSFDAVAAMSNGIINKRTSGSHLLIQLILSVLLVFFYAYDWEYSFEFSIAISILWVLNLVVPLLVLAMLDDSVLKEMIS